MMVNGQMGNFMEKELKLYLMEQYMMESGLKANLMAWECVHIQTQLSILVLG